MTGARALVADDNAHLRVWNRRVLEEAGYEVHEAGDGPALEHALETEGPFDVAVVDVRMPPPTGLRAVAVARQRGDGTPVVFVTGVNDEDLEATVRQLAPAALLIKPFGGDELLHAVRSVVGTTRRPAVRPGSRSK